MPQETWIAAIILTIIADTAAAVATKTVPAPIRSED